MDSARVKTGANYTHRFKGHIEDSKRILFYKHFYTTIGQTSDTYNHAAS